MSLRSLFVVLLLAAPLAGFSQQLSADQLLQHLYGQDYLDQIEIAEPGAIDFLVFENTQGHYTQDMNGVKDISTFPDILAFQPQIEGVEPLTAEMVESPFWLGAYGIPVQPNKYGYFRIGDTGVLFIVYPKDLITILYQKANG